MLCGDGGGLRDRLGGGVQVIVMRMIVVVMLMVVLVLDVVMVTWRKKRGRLG